MTSGRARLTIEGGVGSDHVIATLAGSPSNISPIDASFFPLIEAGSSVEAVTYTNTSNNNATTWQLSGGVLSSGNQVLLSAPASKLDVIFGNSADTINVGAIPRITSIDARGGHTALSVGGGNVAGMAAPLLLKTSDAGNTIEINDANSGGSRDLRFDTNVFQSSVAVGAITLDDASKFSSATLKLGGASDTVHLTNLFPTTSVYGGGGSDNFDLYGVLNSLTVDGQSGVDQLHLLPSSGNVTVLGDSVSLNTIIADRSAAQIGLTGSLTTAGSTGVVSLDGMAELRLPATSQSKDELTVKLGAGNDNFSVDSSGFTVFGIAIEGGAGDDRVTFASVGGGDDSFTINGDAGRDTVILDIPSRRPTNNSRRLYRTWNNCSSITAIVAWPLSGRSMVVKSKATGISSSTRPAPIAWI